MEATHEDNTKQLWRDPCDATCGARGQGETSSTSALGAYKRFQSICHTSPRLGNVGQQMRLLHAANLVCFLAHTPLVGGGLVSHRSEWQSMMVGSTPGRLLETKRHRGLLAKMVCGDGPPAHVPATLPLHGDERQSSERNRPSWPNTLRTAPAQRSTGPDRPTRLMGCTFICSVAPSFVRLPSCLFGCALVCSVCALQTPNFAPRVGGQVSC